MTGLPPSTTRSVYRHALASPDAVAIIEGDGACSYAQLARKIAQMRKRLLGLGIAPGLLVAVACDNRLAHWLVLLACETIGATTVSFIPAELGDENPVLARCHAVVFSAAETTYRPAVPSIDIDAAWLARNFALAVTGAELAALDADPAPDQITRVLISSGTTGAPKAMPTTHRAHLNNIIEKSTFLPPVERPRYVAYYRPTVFAVRALSDGCLRRGGVVVMSSDLTLVHDIALHRPHIMSVLTGHAPAVIELIEAAGLAKPEGFILRLLGAPLGRALRDRLLACLATEVVDGYGCNDAGSLVEFADDDPFGTLAAETEIEIVDEAESALPRGAVGIVKVKTNRMVEGYLGDPDLTARVFRDGWFLTSDLGVMNEAGRVKVIGRRDDTLNLGGIKISPAAIEEKILAVPGIRDAAVLSRRNDDGIEELAAVLELADGVHLPAVEPALRRILAAFYPRQPIVALAKLPRNDAGKLQRGMLADLLKQMPISAIAARPTPTAALPPSTARCIRQQALTAPNAAAFIESGRACSYAQLACNLAQMRERLLGLSIAAGMLVAVACEDRYVHWLVLLACETIGVPTVSFIAAELTPENAVLARCDCLVFTAAETAYRPAMRLIDIDGAWLSQTFALAVTEAALAALEVDPPPDRIIRVLTSSGTTGAPKGMPTTHRSHLNKIIEKSAFLPPEGRPRYVCFYRPTVLSVRALAEGCLRRGGLVILSNDQTLVRDLGTYRPHAMTLLTGHIPMVLDLIRTAHLAKPDGLRVRVIGAPLGREWRDRLLQDLATDVVDHYGCNEAGGVAAFDGSDEFGTLAAETEFEIVDDAGAALPRGMAGIIKLKTNRMVEGYLGDAELTRRHFKDGWFLTGDIGVMNEAGRLKLIGRRDEVLNLGGIKMAPETIEEKIAKLHGISEAAVLSLPNKFGVEELAVAVVMRDDMSLAEIEPSLRRVLGEFYPTRPILAVAKLPRNENGKLQRRLVVDLFKRASD